MSQDEWEQMVTEFLAEALDHIDTLRDFVSEGGSRYMVGAVEAIRNADRFMDEVYSKLYPNQKGVI